MREKTKELGFLLLVEGALDSIRLQAAGVPVPLAVLSNRITVAQANLISERARELGISVALFYDQDDEGENGSRQTLGALCQRVPIMVITRKMFGGRFNGRQPEDLTDEEVAEVLEYLKTGQAKDWSLQ